MPPVRLEKPSCKSQGDNVANFVRFTSQIYQEVGSKFANVSTDWSKATGHLRRLQIDSSSLHI